MLLYKLVILYSVSFVSRSCHLFVYSISRHHLYMVYTQITFCWYIVFFSWHCSIFLWSFLIELKLLQKGRDIRNNETMCNLPDTTDMWILRSTLCIICFSLLFSGKSINRPIILYCHWRGVSSILVFNNEGGPT